MIRKCFVLFAALTILGGAQAEEYQRPSDAIAAVVDAPMRPSARTSPDKKWVALLERKLVVSLSELAKEELKLAGLRINPANFSQSRPRGNYTSIAFQSTGSSDEILNVHGLPKGRILAPDWSPDSKYLAFVVEQTDKATLWLYDIKAKKARELSSKALNSTLTTQPFSWMPDSSGLLVNFVASSIADKPQEQADNIRPIVEQSTGEKAPNRTYQNLLKTPHDEDLFAFYSYGQLALVTPKGKVKTIGKPTLLSNFESSPDAKHILVEQVARPFSYQVPYYRFASRSEVWNFNGTKVAEIAEMGIQDNIPQGYDSVATGRRAIGWRPDVAATLYWAEAQDGGDMKKDVKYHDAVYTWAAPFKKAPAKLLSTEWRYSAMEWGENNLALMTEWRFSDRNIRVWKLDSSKPESKWVKFQQRSYNDEYKDPGDPVYTKTKWGTRVIQTNKDGSILLAGQGASDKGYQPFLDKFDFDSGKKTRLWQSEAPYYESVVTTLNKEGSRILTSRESKTDQPNLFIRDLNKKSLTQLSHFPHPYPAFKGITKENVKYKRKDGVDLSGTLYLPAGYKKSDGPLPVLMWAYPLEYKDKSVAGQVRESPYQFDYIGFWGPMPYLAKGYAIFDDPKMPIVGSGDAEPNDSFRKQLVDSAEAAVNVLVEKGVADPDRIAISGHSYGAFMVANLLAHSDLFRAGIARSGAYNRTLTPFGFQGEERDFWKGQEVYSNMSPFFHAEKINEPILFIHGKDDSNSGTYPMQSERMYAAVKGLGGMARLVMLPYEAHGYRARESLLHVLWEQEQWLDKYLKKK